MAINALGLHDCVSSAHIQSHLKRMRFSCVCVCIRSTCHIIEMIQISSLKSGLQKNANFVLNIVTALRRFYCSYRFFKSDLFANQRCRWCWCWCCSAHTNNGLLSHKYFNQQCMHSRTQKIEPNKQWYVPTVLNTWYFLCIRIQCVHWVIIENVKHIHR